jgi:hypothetical protein
VTILKNRLTSQKHRYGKSTFGNARAFECVAISILICFWWNDQNGVLSDARGLGAAIEVIGMATVLYPHADSTGLLMEFELSGDAHG